MLVLEPKKTSQMYSRNSTTTAQNGCVLSFALDSFMFPHSPKVAIEPPLDHSTNFVLSFALPSFMFPTSPRVAIGPHRMARWPISHLSSCPIGRLSGWPGWRGWPDWPDCPVVCHFLASFWPCWPVTRSPVVPLALGQLSVLDTYFPPKLPRWYSLEHFYFWKWKRVLRRGNKRLNDILNNNISVFDTYFPAKLSRWYPPEHFFFFENESGF